MRGRGGEITPNHPPPKGRNHPYIYLPRPPPLATTTPSTTRAVSFSRSVFVFEIYREDKMYKQSVACLLALMMVLALTEARYLPTRSQDDRLLRLRQLLKDEFYLKAL
ncbi:unnamed protein product [Nezara viridula]|uniref:Uncharacterized protein n=1 Tax=Nezara viridula TaxID=85310 RepID=A0A9P0HPZ7_NEZVI|nr:unnamed protein product [Nezara viridula]